MEKLIWQTYALVYDSILLQLAPYREMISLACRALNPKNEGLYLDAGCGTGNYSLCLLEDDGNFSIIAADNSSSMLKKAKRKMAGRENRVSFAAMDLENPLPYEDCSFDGIICANVLYAVKKPDQLLKELRRVLKNDGRLVLITPPAEPRMAPIVKAHIKALKKKSPRLYPLLFASLLIRTFIPIMISVSVNSYIKNNSSFHFLSEDALRTMIVNNGLSIEKLSLIYGKQSWMALINKSPGSIQHLHDRRRVSHA